jgi:formamidopyrimidine-DNA glycosylase
MAELPEITKLSEQMQEILCGRTVKEVILLQEKCSNVAPEELQRRAEGAKIINVRNKGKWIITQLDNGENLLLSLGMGAEVLYLENEKEEPEKYQIKLIFSDGSGYTARFWWFGKLLIASEDELSSEPNTRDIALDPFDERFTYEYFTTLLRGKRTQIKAFLMDQKNVGGIGNMYMHDILFKSGLHPQKKISDMSTQDMELLYRSIQEVLDLSRRKGAFFYESDFFGQKGGFNTEDFLVGYKENEPCPRCGETILLIKTGSTSSYICPACQKLQEEKS